MKCRISSRYVRSFLALNGNYFMATIAGNIRRRLRLAVALCFVVFVVACSSDNRPPRFPVQGQVFVEGKPAHRAIVWFHPVNPAEPGSPRPRGVVDEAGEFRMGTYDSKDGVPAGKYRVAISWTGPVKSGDEDGPRLIPRRYQDPSKSGIPVVEVQSDSTTLPAFQLTKR
jgi:hypothetical protein